MAVRMCGNTPYGGFSLAMKPTPFSGISKATNIQAGRLTPFYLLKVPNMRQVDYSSPTVT